jgi:phospholipase/carboxylesterase
VEWREYMMPHSMCPEEVVDLGHWLRRILPA